MLSTLVLIVSQAGPGYLVADTPGDPLLSKCEMGNTPAYLRRLNPDERVHVALGGDIKKLAREVVLRRGTVQTRTKSVLTVLIPAGELLKLAESPALKMISQGFLPSSGVFRPEPNFASEAVKFPVPLTPLPHRPYGIKSWPLGELRSLKALTGRGVLLGVVEDRAADFRHRDFQTDDGKSRLVALWDQWSKAGTFPAGFGYGRHFRREEIDLMISGNQSTGLVFGSTADHVTASMGASGGNGSGVGKFCGVAPEAMLANVSTIGTCANMIDAARFLFKIADAKQVPCVLNVSLAPSQLQGLPEDGSELVSVALSEMVREKGGRAIVSSAGNQAAAKGHIRGNLSETLKSAYYLLSPYQKLPRLLHSITTSPKADIEIRLCLVSKQDTATTICTGRWMRLALLKPGGGRSLELLSENSGFVVQLIPKWHPRGKAILALDIVPKQNSEKLAIRVEYRGKGEFDAYSHGYLGFLSPSSDNSGFLAADNLQSVGAPANGEAVIACGAYLDGSGVGPVADYSQPGGALLGSYKPLLLAPTDVPAAIAIDSSQNDDRSKVLEGAHEMYGGTSAAGPCLAGAIALYLQKHPKANARQIERALINASGGDLATGSVPNPKCGYGKLDLRKLLGP